MMVTFTRCIVLGSSLLLACVGDSTVGGDSGVDASGSDANGDATPLDASDAGDGASSPEGGDAACGFQGMSLHANCTQTSCLHATDVTCESSPSACGGANGKVLDCGSTGDCDASACCLAASLSGTTACPSVVDVGLTSPVTVCSANTSKACAGGQIQVCASSAECFSGTCHDAVFNFNGMKLVHFGTCR
jgi:hypothetical protein